MRKLDELIADIQEREKTRMKAAETVREEAADTVLEQGGALEDQLLTQVSADTMEDTTVAGVDGGLMKKEFHGIDMMMVRAVAAIFDYENGVLAQHRYRPETNPSPEIVYSTESRDRGEADRLASLHRLAAETGLAANVAGDTDVLLLDGALAPQYADRPAKDSRLRERYDDLIDTYTTLYENAAEQNVLLAGIVEDTRSAKLCELLQENGFTASALDSCRDSHLLHYLLETGERTAVVPYSSSTQHTVLKDLGDHGDNLYSFYLKTVEHDRPIRIDFYAATRPVKTADRIASQVYAISGAHDSYGVPAVIIEADKRAKLKKHEVDLALNRIQSRLGHLSGLSELRRDRRPF